MQLLLAVLLAFPTPPSASAPPTPLGAVDDRFVADVEFLLDEFEEQAGQLLDQKDIDWRKVRAEFTKAAKKTESVVEHIELVGRLIARLRDGHARFDRVDVDMSTRAGSKRYGCGLDLVEVGKKIYVCRTYGSAADAGVQAGWEVTRIDGEKPAKWLEAAVERLSDTRGFSTDHGARWMACSWGLVGDDGERIKFEFKKGKKGKSKKTLTFSKSGGQGRLYGPVVFPEGLQTLGRDVAWTTLPSGHGYIQVGRVPGELHELLDRALAELAEAPGIVLDFRANLGGGYDRDAVLGRFVPKGESWGGEASAGPNPYGGPLIVLADPGTVSAGETIVGELKEEGRAYLIGPGPTRGASSQKTVVEAPSGLFAVRFSIRSNKQRFNGGRGVEGLGIEPDEIVEYDPELLLEGVDPAIARAVELFEKPLPKKAVQFVPPGER